MERPSRVRPDTVHSPLDTYLREINQFRLLTAKEERELAEAMRNGSAAEAQRAREQMVRANLRLVVNIARNYQGKGLSLQDLIAEGNLGLIRAVEGFDPTRNTRFSTYASFWIKQSMRRTLLNSARTVRLPAYLADLVAKWRRASAALQEKLGRAPTDEEVARRLNLSKKKVHLVKQALGIATVTPRGDPAKEGDTMDEMVMDANARPPDSAIIEADKRRRLQELLERMDPREATVIRQRFGLDGGEPKTLQDIGVTLGLTRERVRQIERDALLKLGEGMGRD